MALLNFPPDPDNGDVYPQSPFPGQVQYQWDATNLTWKLLGTATGVTSGTYGDAYNVGQFTVDSAGRITFAQNVPIETTDGTVTEIDTGVGLGGGPITTTGTIFLDVSYTDSRYLQLSGGTLTGPITFAAGQVFPGSVTQVNTGLGLTGGPVTSVGTISLDTAYTDGRYLRLSGGTLTGPLRLPDGTISSPALTFSSGPFTGFYYDSATSTVNLARNGTLELTVGNDETTLSSNLVIPSGFSANIAGFLNLLQPGSQVRFYDSDNSNYVGFLGPITATGNVMWRLPNADGTSGQVLTTNGSGQLSWAPGGPPTLQAVTTAGNTTTTPITANTITTTGNFQITRGGNVVGLLSGDASTISYLPSPFTVAGTARFSSDAYLESNGVLRFYGVGNSNFIGLKAPASFGSDITFTLPSAYGLSGQVLTTDGSGNLFWGAQAETGTVSQVNSGTGLTGGPITTSGTISLVPATTTSLGGVIPDGTTLSVSPTGVLSAVGRSSFGQIDNLSGSFNGTLKTFPITVGGVPFTPGDQSNILISLGGVLQIPGPAFTITGSSITFDTAPLAGTTFAGYIITNGSSGSSVGNLQQVTNIGATTTNAITVGGLTSTGNVTLGDSNLDRVSVPARVASSFIPSADTTYDLGSATNRWRDLYVSSNSIYMGANQLTVSGGQLLLNGSPVGGGGSVGDLQQVTTAGNTTTDTITVGGITAAGLIYPSSDGSSGQVLVTDGSGNLSWTGFGGGTVTSILTDGGITGGPINSTGTVSLTNTGVAAAAYTYASITVDEKGRITLASSGDAPNTTISAPITNTGTAVAPVIGIQNATTGQLGAVQVGANIDVAAGTISVKSSSLTQSGIVQLNDTVVSTSKTEALTANQGKNLQDQISALSVTSNLTLAGTFDADTSKMLTVTTDGTAQSFAVGSDLPAAVAGNLDYFVIVTAPGSYSPPGGGGPYDASQGDWFLSNGSSWQYLNVGSDLPTASTGTAGVVQLATALETQTGTSTTLAVTPAGAASTYLPITSLSAKGTILSASAANVPLALPVGGDNQILTACGAAASGLCWVTPPTPVAAIPCSVLTAKGSIVAATAANTPGQLVVGVDNQILVACSAATTGLCWVAPPVPAIPCSCITAKGSLIAGSAASTPVALPVGADNTFLMANSACSSGIEWATGGLGDTPVGSVQYFAMSTAPSGWLVADGSAVSRTTYSSLFAAIGTTYGAGDGTSTFNLPDLRGMFARGWDAAGGTARGCDPGRAFGSNQGFALQAHCHVLEVFNGAAGRPEWACPNNACPAGSSYPNPSGGGPVTTAGFTSTNGSAETRPVNVAMLPCIKWKVTLAPASTDATPTVAGTVLGCTDATNAALGRNAMLTGGGANNIAIGLNALRTSNSSDNIAIGCGALCANTAGFQNTAVGHIAMCSLTGASANQNVALGTSTLCAFTTGLSNDAIGALALISFQSGCYNVSVGGYSSFCYVTGNFSTAVGHRALNLATGCCNTSLGAFAGENITTGRGNVALGPYTHISDPTANNQLAIGFAPGCNWLTGDCNKNIYTTNSFVIPRATVACAATTYNNGDTGFYPDGTSGAFIRMGNTFTGGDKAFIQFFFNQNIIGRINSSGTTGTQYLTTSDYRLKENVKDLEGATEVLRALPVREYNFISEPEVTRQGFLAHELQEFVPQAVSGEKDKVDEEGNPDYQGVDASQVVPLLVAALKESIARIDVLEKKVAELGG